jgi:hypothetical protein
MGCPSLSLGTADDKARCWHETNGQWTARNANNFRSLSQKHNELSGIGAAISAYIRTCSQYLTGPGGGPTTFYMPCSAVKSGS